MEYSSTFRLIHLRSRGNVGTRAGAARLDRRLLRPNTKPLAVRPSASPLGRFALHQSRDRSSGVLRELSRS